MKIKGKLEDNIMNLMYFLKQADSLTARYTAGQLASFIHDGARVLPEKHRADFLKRLKEADAVGQDAQEKADRCSISTFDSDYEAIKKNLETIETGEVSISSEYNEEYVNECRRLRHLKISITIWFLQYWIINGVK